MRELRPGLGHCQAPHPQWESSEPWDEEVSSYAVDDARRETEIVLTAPWHERDAQAVVDRLAAPVDTPLPDTAEYLVREYGITAEQAGEGSPDAVWLLREGEGEARPYAPGDRLPFGADVYAGRKD